MVALRLTARDRDTLGHAARHSADAREAAGWPIFGQFIAHDITADRSPVTHHAEPERIRNYRTPRANLESIYAGGPMGSPYLFDRADGAKLLLGDNGSDVPRNSQGVALIGDPRNDVHVFMSQMQLAFIRAHNLLVDRKVPRRRSAQRRHEEVWVGRSAQVGRGADTRGLEQL